VSARGFGAWLSLAHQAVSLEVEFGRHALEALAGIAETVEESVYEAGSLHRTDRGLEFALANPPLRVGAFRSIRVVLNGVPAPPASTGFRSGPGLPWTLGSSISRGAPFEFRPGQRTELRVEPLSDALAGRVDVRLELVSSAIPPLVWLEFRDELRELPRP
jgi:hypothetical protein